MRVDFRYLFSLVETPKEYLCQVLGQIHHEECTHHQILLQWF